MACAQKWAAKMRDCSSFNASKKRIISLGLTRNFGEKHFHRMALVDFSHGRQQNVHLYDIGNNNYYYFDNNFAFLALYKHLVGHNSLITAVFLQSMKQMLQI